MRLVLVLAATLLAGAAHAQQTPAPTPPDLTKPLPFAEGFPQRVPAPGGEVIFSSRGERANYDAVHYAPARRVGDTLYVSGVIAGVPPGGDMEAFRTSLRLAFRRIERTLKAAGAGFEDVVMINSFHVWESPDFAAGKEARFAAVAAVKDEFMSAPHPAWTAVGTTGLLGQGGLVEIQVIARIPAKTPERPGS